ncbi:MAG: hypothetical protein ACE5EI_03735 [Thermodesulfobacteriota bacterium]
MQDIEITITCPVCETKFAKMARELKDGSVIKCPKCGERTTIKGTMFTDLINQSDA